MEKVAKKREKTGGKWARNGLKKVRACPAVLLSTGYAT